MIARGLTMPKRKYSEETIEKAIEMRESGLGRRAVAKALGMSPGAVDYHCLKLGADVPGAMKVWKPKVMRSPRGNHFVRRFSEFEDAIITQMSIDGKGVNEIAKHLGRRHNSITGRLRTLARREEQEMAA